MKSLPFTAAPEYKTYLYSPEFSEAAIATLGNIHVDPCAGPKGQFIRADQEWNGLTPKMDGFTKQWSGNVFFNCDNYERPLKNKQTGELVECPHVFHKMSEWTAKLLYELETGRTKNAIGFFPCRMFKPWAHSLVLQRAAAICYHTRKIQFYVCRRLAAGEYETNRAIYSNVGDGYMTVLFSPSAEMCQDFARNYQGFGTVVRSEVLRVTANDPDRLAPA